MPDLGELMAVLVLWLAFMTVLGVYTVRIVLMLRAQHLTRRAYRLHLAMERGKAARDAAGAGER